MRKWVVVVMLVVLSSGLPLAQVAAQGCEPQTDVIVVEASVDNPTPYVGEQIVYTVQIFNTTQSSPTLEIPAFEGFWAGGVLEIGTYEQPDCGITVGVTVNERILFPLRPGELVIPPGTLDFSANPVYEARTRVESSNVAVDVRPLPDGAPDDFSGAVGYPFFIDAQVGRETARVGDPISLRVTIEGAGNIEQINAPELPLPDSWRTYGQPTRVNTAAEGRLLVGTKTFEWLFVPDEAGTVSVPPISFSYFDTNTEIYRTVTTDPIPLSILPAADVPAVPDNLPELTLDLEPGVLAIKPVPGSLGQWRVPGLWVLWLVAPLLFVGSAWWRWWQYRASEEVVRRRRQGALRNARANLATVTRRRGDMAYKQLIMAVLTYFGDRWNTEPMALDQSELQQGMAAAGVDGDVIEGVMVCLREAEQGRYAPEDASPPRALVKQTLMALAAVDNALGRS